MQLIDINPENPQENKIQRIVDQLKKGAVIIYPTDSRYAFGCDLFNKEAIEKLCLLKNEKPEKMQFSFICKDISQISEYARQFDNSIFKFMKRVLPGPYTFILNASQIVPKIVQAKKKTVGVRIPDNKIVMQLVEALGNPLITSTVKLSEEHVYQCEPWYLADFFQKSVDIVVDGGTGNMDETTVLDCTTNAIEIIRLGKGEVEL